MLCKDECCSEHPANTRFAPLFFGPGFFSVLETLNAKMSYQGRAARNRSLPSERSRENFRIV